VETQHRKPVSGDAWPAAAGDGENEVGATRVSAQVAVDRFRVVFDGSTARPRGQTGRIGPSADSAMQVDRNGGACRGGADPDKIAQLVDQQQAPAAAAAKIENLLGQLH
jgi:hypothetical protein